MTGVTATSLVELMDGFADVGGLVDVQVEGLSMDSQRVRPGDLFMACEGASVHGLGYAQQAAEQGASAIAFEVTERFPDAGAARQQIRLDVPLVAVPELKEHAGFIADRFYHQPSRQLLVVGITGTDGKTSCSHFLARALDELGGSSAVIGTLGYGLVDNMSEASHTTPDAVRVHALMYDMLNQGADAVVMEVSSHALDQGRVNGIAFDTAVLTNISRDHLDYHGNVENYEAAKARLFAMPGLRCAVINNDDRAGQRLLAAMPQSVTAVAYGFEDYRGDAAFVQGHDLVLDARGFRFGFTSPWGGGEIRSHLLGGFNASNLLAVAAVLLQRGHDAGAVCEVLSGLATVNGRMEAVDIAGKPLVVIDYAHTPKALEQALLNLREHCHGRLVCVFGCGGNRDSGKRPEMGRIASRLADVVILTNDNPRDEDPGSIVADIKAGPCEGCEVEYDRATAIEKAIGMSGSEDLVLVAGKGHETVQVIAGDSFYFNDREQVLRVLEGGQMS